MLHFLLKLKRFWCAIAIFCFSVQAYPISRTQPIIAQYFGIWAEQGQTWEQKFRSDTPFDKLTRLYISFGKIIKKEDGHFSINFDGSTDHVHALIDRIRAVNPHAEIFLTVGGNGNDDSFGGAANDDLFAMNVRDFLLSYGMNGFDIDWEEGLNKQALNKLTQNLYQVLHAVGDQLTLDVWPYAGMYDMSTLRNSVDQINVMSYGTGLSLANIVPIFIQAGFPAEKIIGGIETESGYNQFGGVTDSLGPDGTIVAKAKYVLSHGMAGMMEWRLDNDYATADNPLVPTYQGALLLWSAMYNNSSDSR